MNEIKTKEEILKEVMKDFTHFLRKNGIYHYYKRNLTDRLMYNGDLHVRDWKLGFLYGIQIKMKPLTFFKCSELINYAFCWDETPQGQKFWYSYHEQWKQFAMKKYLKYKNILNN